MNLTRRNFLGHAIAMAAVPPFAGCVTSAPITHAKVAVQLYSIRDYINPKKGGVGLAKALADVAKIGYKGVEFAGYYGFKAAEIKKMLDDNGLKAAGTHVGHGAFAPDKIQETIDFNLGYGNTHLICPGGIFKPKNYEKGEDAWWEYMTAFFNTAADTASAAGCTLGYHNHVHEFEIKTHGTCMWDYFFANTRQNVCMEQDVGWTTAAGSDPLLWYKRFPHRSPTLHAKENARDLATKKDAPKFEGILGEPGVFPDGKVVKGVDWDALLPVADEDGVKWLVVECERNAASLKAIESSYKFLVSKGRS